MSCFTGISKIQWSVKNTFVEPVELEPAEQNKPNLKQWYYSSDLTHARDSNARFYVQRFVDKLFAARDRTREEARKALTDSLEDSGEELEESEEQQDENTEEALAEESLEGSQYPSVGSAGHYEGTCSPCAHFWRPDSCSKKSSCEFCHLCPDGEHKRRKQEKIKALRAAEKAERKAQRAALKEASNRPDTKDEEPACPSGPVLLGTGRDLAKDAIT